jgi:hypothetical protein
MEQKLVRMNESQFKQMISESAKRVIKHILENFDYDNEYSIPDSDHSMSELEEILNQSYPGRNFTCEVTDEGDVVAVDEDGNAYYGDDSDDALSEIEGKIESNAPDN